ncbi:MAG: HD-GYP domain-containing protein [Armatimonadota bacterium]
MNEMYTSFLSVLPLTISIIITIIALYISYKWLPDRMQNVYRQSLLTLSRAVEVKDTRSEGKGERIAKHMVAISELLKIPRKQRPMMEFAAFLHDIGNVRVPHYILNKTEPLTDEEMVILKAQPVIGSEIVSQVKFLEDIAPILRHQYEAWNGSGYPDHLQGDAIPLGSRMLAVCAAYDSITHPRGGEAALSENERIAAIRSGSGILFDPMIVEAFIKILKENH